MIHRMTSHVWIKIYIQIFVHSHIMLRKFVVFLSVQSKVSSHMRPVCALGGFVCKLVEMYSCVYFSVLQQHEW